MKRANLPEVFAVPEYFKPPPDAELLKNTYYPNLNSLTFRVNLKNEPKVPKLQKYFEIIDVNTLGNAVIACNDYSGSVWNGNFWGFETIEDVAIVKKASYKVRMHSAITNLKFCEANMVNIFHCKIKINASHFNCIIILLFE